MKKLYLYITLFIISNVCFSQYSVDKGRVQVKLGAGVYVADKNISNVFDNNNNNVVNLIGELSINYNTHKNFALGIFISDIGKDDTDSTKYNTNSLGLELKYYIINKQKFNLFLDTRFGSLNYNENNLNRDGDNISIKGKGSINSLGLGINKYFGNVVGVYFKIGCLRQAYMINNYNRNKVKNINYIGNNKTIDIKTKYNGFYTNIGISIKLRNKSPKSE